jgi:copper chaperone NosL
MIVASRLALLLLVFFSLFGCKIGPEPIDYGTDTCHFCSMTIVDKQHGSEWVTDKGKVFKFDSVECLLNHRSHTEQEKIAMYMCNHFTSPGELISAENAIYLISEGLPSPMGAYLTAFDSRASAMRAQSEHGGELYNWNELLEHWEDTYVYDK